MPESLPNEIKVVQENMLEFIETVVRPMTEQTKDATLSTAASEIRKASIDRGFFGKTQPAEYGGCPASNLELTVLRETLAAANSPLTSHVFGPGPGILHSAEGILKTRYLDPVLRGEKRGAFGFTEPDSAKRPTWAELDVTGLKRQLEPSSLTASFVDTAKNNEIAKLRKALQQQADCVANHMQAAATTSAERLDR